jgi:hypothetical protein
MYKCVIITTVSNGFAEWADVVIQFKKGMAFFENI